MRLGRAGRQRGRRKRGQSTDHMERLRVWLRERGWSEDVRLKAARFPTTGRGLQAITSIDGGSTIVSIPAECIIVPGTVDRSPIGGMVKELPAALKLCAFLLFERIQGHSSIWGPYLATLPKSYTNLAYMNDAVDSLPAVVRDAFLRQRQEIDNSLGLLRSALDISFARWEFEWTWFTVNTRVVSLDDTVALVPYLDLFNHSPFVQTRAGFSSERGYFLTIDRPFSCGRQVFINYGPHDNMKLLLEYGFVVEGNPNDVVRFTLDDIREACGSFSVHFRKFALWDIEEGLVCDRSGPSWMLERVVQTACLGLPLEPQVVFRSELDVSLVLRSQVCQVLHQLLSMKLEYYLVQTHDCANSRQKTILLALLHEHIKILKKGLFVVEKMQTPQP
ncbi:unnamed protein product [Darwinula stevensoni]|uniref:SET domain-containing protein n=1 Tax=Darwinula stevensoni TaxID=69355 RepID=A0A7R9AAE9_9CRUS|nr:unnamed protein product [Darwinula stevensoni]CAG0898195.1 unnamed protein product [Darwinula stevensoni]